MAVTNGRELLFDGEEVLTPIKVERGTRFQHEEGEEYILSTFHLDEKWYAVLISLDDGNRWVEPQPLADQDNFTPRITRKDVDRITHNGKFEVLREEE